MKRYLIFLVLLYALILCSCSSSRKAFDPNRKYPVASLQEDYTVFRNVLEHYHPSIYWFTPKDSMDYFFNKGYEQLNDSLTEPQFRNVLLNVITKIRCGHTSLRYSKRYAHYLDTARLKAFPLSFKVWPDSVAVIGSLRPGDSIFRRGTVVRSINGMPMRKIVDTFLNYLVTDGNALVGKYQTLSARGSFGSLYRNLFGLPNQFDIEYVDPNGNIKTSRIPVFVPVIDTSKKQSRPVVANRPTPNRPSAPAINPDRNLQIDTTLSSAYMTINTFSRGHGIRRFLKESFRELKERSIQHLVIDVRANGGGDPNLSTLLTRYLIDRKFKLADSLYAVRKSGPYNKHIKYFFFYRLSLLFAMHKKQDGKYHFSYFEKHYYKPKKKNHFNNNVYIITGGNSFSATTIFAKSLKGQKNVLIVGEETGGGAYGNTAWKIPDVVLPNTKMKFRLPLFRLVMDTAAIAAGRGIIPDIEAAPTVETIRKGIDPKVEKVKEIILQRNAVSRQ